MKRIALFMQEKVYIYEIPDEELERVKELEELVNKLLEKGDK